MSTENNNNLLKCKEVNTKPFMYAMSLIDGTHKMLSKQLNELEADDLIIRTEYPQVPPKVEYRLSERGESLMPVLQALCNWGHEHIDD